MILDQWWVYVGIVAWAALLDSATLLSASGTYRFLLTPLGVLFLLIHAAAALIAGLLMPVLLTDNLNLDEIPGVVIFLAPLITVTALDFLLGQASASSSDEQVDLTGLLGDLRRKTIVEARRKESLAKQTVDIAMASSLAAKCDPAQLRRLLLNLLHTKMPTLQNARDRLELLTKGMPQDDDLTLRQELATELVKLDRDFARTSLKLLGKN